MIKSRLSFFHFIFLMLLIFGCSSTPVITDHTIPIVVPAVKDSIVLRDSVIYKDSIRVDSLWFGEVRDSVNKVIGDLKVWYKSKIAKLNLKPRIDSVIVSDTVMVKTPGTVLETVSGFLNWWEESLVILVAVLLITWKAKRKLPL